MEDVSFLFFCYREEGQPRKSKKQTLAARRHQPDPRSPESDLQYSTTESGSAGADTVRPAEHSTNAEQGRGETVASRRRSPDQQNSATNGGKVSGAGQSVREVPASRNPASLHSSSAAVSRRARGPGQEKNMYVLAM